MRVGIPGPQLSANGEPRLGNGFLPLGEKRVAHPYPSQARHHDGREDSFLPISVCQGREIACPLRLERRSSFLPSNAHLPYRMRPPFPDPPHPEHRTKKRSGRSSPVSQAGRTNLRVMGSLLSHVGLVLVRLVLLSSVASVGSPDLAVRAAGGKEGPRFTARMPQPRLWRLLLVVGTLFDDAAYLLVA